jgi:Leucine-rich repeat (LRR) protein
MVPSFCSLFNRPVLSENLIYGQIPAEVSSLPTLRGLAIDRGYKSGPSLYGSIPSFDKVPQLVYLYLEGNQLQGSIPRNFLSSSKFARIIELSSNLLTGSIPSELLSLEGLNLQVDGNQIQSFPKAVCDRTDWMSGAISQRGCDGFLCPPGTSSPIGRSTNSSIICLECDILDGAPFYGSRSCVGPASEREILVNLYNNLGGDDWLRNDFWLTSVDVCDWYGIACVAGNVVEINLRGNNLRGLPGPNLFFLSELRILWLYSNPITFSFENIGHATKLQDLRLDATKLHSLHGVGAATSLVSFNAQYTELKGPFSEDILLLSNLRVLSLGNNGITGTLPKSISNLKYLVSLRLHSNRLTGPVPSLEGIHFVRHLDLSDNLLTGSISKKFLSSAPSDGPLRIRLAGNQLTGIIPEEFDRFQTVSLFLSDNKILGIPFTFCDNADWNEGDVGDFGCDGIMCRPGSYNPIGRRVSGMDCLGCHSARYYGSTSCDIPIPSLANRSPTFLGSLVIASVVTSLLVYWGSMT